MWVSILHSVPKEYYAALAAGAHYPLSADQLDARYRASIKHHASYGEDYRRQTYNADNAHG